MLQCEIIIWKIIAWFCYDCRKGIGQEKVSTNVNNSSYIASISRHAAPLPDEKPRRPLVYILEREFSGNVRRISAWRKSCNLWQSINWGDKSKAYDFGRASPLSMGEFRQERIVGFQASLKVYADLTWDWMTFQKDFTTISFIYPIDWI